MLLVAAVGAGDLVRDQARGAPVRGDHRAKRGAGDDGGERHAIDGVAVVGVVVGGAGDRIVATGVEQHAHAPVVGLAAGLEDAEREGDLGPRALDADRIAIAVDARGGWILRVAECAERRQVRRAGRVGVRAVVRLVDRRRAEHEVVEHVGLDVDRRGLVEIDRGLEAEPHVGGRQCIVAARADHGGGAIERARKRRATERGVVDEPLMEVLEPVGAHAEVAVDLDQLPALATALRCRQCGRGGQQAGRLRSGFSDALFLLFLTRGLRGTAHTAGCDLGGGGGRGQERDERDAQ